jgi:hypothetical protein
VDRETGPTSASRLAPPPRRLLVVMLVRSILSITIVVVVYFVVPLTEFSEARSVAVFVGALLLVVVVLGFQARGIVRSSYPLLRTVEALATTGPLFLIVFASTHYVIGSAEPGSYTEPMTRLDSLYFTVTTFATVGYGDISPVSEAARLVATLQMLLGLVFIGLVARVITGATQLGIRRRREDHHDA